MDEIMKLKSRNDVQVWNMFGMMILTKETETKKKKRKRRRGRKKKKKRKKEKKKTNKKRKKKKKKRITGLFWKRGEAEVY
jgi:DNA invertase Pin-like site-specific DNA recombinase